MTFVVDQYPELFNNKETTDHIPDQPELIIKIKHE